MSEMNDNRPAINPEELSLFSDLCDIINGAKSKVATYLNTEICMTNWYVGKRIKEDVLYNQRAEYGKKILQDIADRLTEKFGQGWRYQKLQQCVRAAYILRKRKLCTHCVHN